MIEPAVHKHVNGVTFLYFKRLTILLADFNLTIRVQL